MKFHYALSANIGGNNYENEASEDLFDPSDYAEEREIPIFTRSQHHTWSLNNPLSIRNDTIYEYVIFGTQKSQDSMDELDYYLDYRRTAVALRNSDPLLWWQQQQAQFPTLSKLARKYLGMLSSPHEPGPDRVRDRTLTGSSQETKDPVL
ncbi:1114_t:CDS:2 [Ambispora gerdemannii]|uniref:1114_t:CDS:1 n=1 Tax=Ambispora gerdemannii TaxID=144530 RepID=A0A9N9DIB5_9GLOM|nr:1114_t:CDS:2 [Ambispora gerdemannii]